MFPDVVTPAVLIERSRLDRNIHRMVRQASRLRVGLRPHAKTVKSPELLEGVVSAGVVGLTVSTLGEVASLRHLVDDLLYAVPVAAGKAAPVLRALDVAATRLTVVVDDVAGIDGIPADPRVDAAIEVDSDGLRGGVRADGPDLVELAERISARTTLRGVVTHHGGSYLGTAATVGTAAAAERDAVVLAASRLRDAGHAVGLVSVGSTPTALAADDLAGVDEIRPGVYLLCDRSMVALGVCSPGDVAISVLATVIGRISDDRIIIDAGWSALGRDPGVPAIGPEPGLGAVGPDRPDLEGSTVVSATQEHGIVAVAPSAGVSIGDRLRIVPNHACATAEMHGTMVVVDGPDVVGRVQRPRGWTAPAGVPFTDG